MSITMSILEDDFNETVIPLAFAEFADESRVTLTPKSGTTIRPWAIVDNEERKEKPTPNGMEVTYQRTVTICIDATSDYYAGASNIKLNAGATVDRVDYSVAGVTDKGTSYMELLLSRPATSEQSRAGYRDRQSYSDKLNRT